MKDRLLGQTLQIDSKKSLPGARDEKFHNFSTKSKGAERAVHLVQCGRARSASGLSTFLLLSLRQNQPNAALQASRPWQLFKTEFTSRWSI